MAEEDRSCSLPPTWKWKLIYLSIPVLQAWSCTGGGALTEAAPPPWARLLMLSARHSAAVTAPPDGIWELLVPAGRLHSGWSAAAAPPLRMEVGRSSGVFPFMALEPRPLKDGCYCRQSASCWSHGNRLQETLLPSDPNPSLFLERRQRQSDVEYRNNVQKRRVTLTPLSQPNSRSRKLSC